MDFPFDAGAWFPALLYAVSGLPFFIFTALMLKGTGKPGGKLYESVFFKCPRYRRVFRLHRRPSVTAASLTLTGCFLAGLWDLADPYLSINYAWPLLMYPLWFLLYLAFGGQGLTVALDRRLALSWDLDDSLALHLTQRKINSLSPGFVGQLSQSVVDHRRKLLSLGIANPLTLESWLLAPPPDRRLQEVKAFHGLIRLKRLKKLYPSRASWYFDRMKRCSITWQRIKRLIKRCRAEPGRHSYRGPLRIFRLLRLLIAIQKTLAAFLAAVVLVACSPWIRCARQRLPKPAFNSSHSLSNGSPATKICQDAEQQLLALAPSWTATSLPLKRMNMLTIILLVASHPKVASSLSGWVGGMKIR